MIMPKHRLTLFTAIGLYLLLQWGVLQLPIWQHGNDLVSDHWVKKEAEKGQFDSDILFINIDDESLKNFEPEVGKWPWPRSVHGYLLEALKPLQPKVIIFDMFFASKDIYRLDSDIFFNEQVSGEIPIYMASSFLNESSPVEAQKLSELPSSFFIETPDNTHRKTPSTKFQKKGLQNKAQPETEMKLLLPEIISRENWKTGLVNFYRSDDLVGRNYPMFHEKEGWKIPYMSYLVARDVFDIKEPPPVIRLKYQGTEKSLYQHLSYYHALALLNNSPDEDTRAFFKDKIIFIGASATGLNDLRATPVSLSQPAMLILATALDNLIHGDYFRVYSEHWSVALSLLFSLVILCWILFKLSYKLFLIQAGLTTLILILGLWILAGYTSSKGFLFPVAAPAFWCLLTFILVSFYRGIREYLDKQMATRIFSRFMDPNVVSTLIQEDDWKKSLQSRSGPLTVLFSDIRGFTSLSESRTAEQVIDLLNKYFDTQVGAIFNHNGTLDKFIGDAVMAFWGAPLEDKNQAVNAVKAALEMSQNLEKFKQQLGKELENFEIGIGIHSGDAVVGMLGSQKRYDYTAIGDTVNLASRIEGVTKGRARILISEATMQACGDIFFYRSHGSFEVKGRKQAVNLYEPMIVKPGVDSSVQSSTN